MKRILRIKEAIIVGIVIFIPTSIFFVMISTLINFSNFWQEAFKFFGAGEYYNDFFGLILLVVFLYIFGWLLTSNFVSSILLRIPIVKNFWKTVYSMIKRVSLVSQGGYKRVIFEEFGPGLGRWIAGIVIGRTIFEDEKGNEKIMLVVLPLKIGFPTSKWLEPRDTRIVDQLEGDQKLLSVILSGGLVNPERLKVFKWTEEQYNELPTISSEIQ